MRKTKVSPFKKNDKPQINTPTIYGASLNCPFLYKVPISGVRPMKIYAQNLPEGLTICETSGIIKGKVSKKCNQKVIIIAENSFGTCKKELTISIDIDNILLTPLMGWTSWNAFAWNVTQENIEKAAELLVSSGLSDYGYNYVNTDSAWQGQYGGKYDAIMPNKKFPDIKKMTNKIHSLGLKCGIYSTPMKNAWGLEDASFGLPGCTQGETDFRFAANMGGIGKEHFEEKNVTQWKEWEFDYLKYDWSPCDPNNAEIMRKCLKSSGRDFGFCVTVAASEDHAEYWSENCSSWRNNPDSTDEWERVLKIFATAIEWQKYINRGHFFDLDMLETGYFFNHQSKLSEDEQIFAYSFRAFFASPLQLSCDLEKLSDFDMSLYCNEEIIAINQDAMCSGAILVNMTKEFDDSYNTVRHTEIYKRSISGGNTALGFFNPGETDEILSFDTNKTFFARDNWAKEDLGIFENRISLFVPKHCARIITISNP